jgi:hypothetical protein
VRFATEKFSLDDIDSTNWKYTHLTNYAVNKSNSNSSGVKSLYSDLLLDLKDGGYNITKLQDAIHDLIIKTIISV